MLKYCLLLILISTFLIKKKTEKTHSAMPNATQKKLHLKELNADFEMYFPSELDSFSIWDGDCCTGGLVMNGFWSPKYGLFKRNYGLCIPDLPDSIFQFIVMYSDRPDTFQINNATAKRFEENADSKHFDAYRSKINWKMHEIKQLGNRKFLVLAKQIHISERTKQWSNRFEADFITRVNDRLVWLNFQYYGNSTTDVFGKIWPFVQTVRFYRP
jgi:hypothetical protein